MGPACALVVRSGLPRVPGRCSRLPALAVLTHPILDWLNNYGMRWLMPFDGRWFYGDALFIVDPWVWLALGGVLFLGWSRNAWSSALWAVFGLLATWLLFRAPFVPAPARALWVAGVVAFAVAGFSGRSSAIRSRPSDSRASHSAA